MQNEQCLRNFDLSEYRQVLSDIAVWIYQVIFLNVFLIEQTTYLNVDQMVPLHENESYNIGLEVWHQGQNNTDTDVHILEVQYGTACVEEDIEREQCPS